MYTIETSILLPYGPSIDLYVYLHKKLYLNLSNMETKAEFL